MTRRTKATQADPHQLRSPLLQALGMQSALHIEASGCLQRGDGARQACRTFFLQAGPYPILSAVALDTLSLLNMRFDSAWAIWSFQHGTFRFVSGSHDATSAICAHALSVLAVLQFLNARNAAVASRAYRGKATCIMAFSSVCCPSKLVCIIIAAAQNQSKSAVPIPESLIISHTYPALIVCSPSSASAGRL